MNYCPNCRYQVADEEIQCPNCFLVLKQLICGNCKNLLDLRYLQCVFCGQPYALPYQRQVQEPSQQDPPEVKEQQYSNQPVTQFNMQASKSPQLSNKASDQTEKRKDGIFDRDKPKGLKLMLWAMRPANGKTLTMRENLKLFLMMLGCAVIALIIIIAGFNIKDLIDNNTAANERKQVLAVTENSNTFVVPTEQAMDNSSSKDALLKSNTSSSFNMTITELEIAREKLLDKYAETYLVSRGWEEQNASLNDSTGEIENGELLIRKIVYLNKNPANVQFPNLVEVYGCAAIVDSQRNIIRFEYTAMGDKKSYETEQAYTNYVLTTPSIWIAALTGESKDSSKNILENMKSINETTLQNTKNGIRYTIVFSVISNALLYQLYIEKI